MFLAEKRYELEKKIVETVYQRSKDFNGTGEVNYAYAAGAFEMMIRRLIDVMGSEELELVNKRIFKN